MKKITTKKLSKKLARYGALTAAILGVSEVSGQIIYTDVDPDFGDTGGIYQIDMDGDATIDYEVRHVGGSAAMRVYNDQSNSILGLAGSGAYNYPYALSSGAAISNGAFGSWITDPALQTLNWNSCAYPGSQWCGGIVDGYLGLRFNIGGNTHYGWARLDVSADATVWLIKDFAYQATPDTPILAGQILSVENQIFDSFSYYVDSNSQLNLKANSPLENIQIFNLVGQEVVSQKLSNNNETINMSSLNTGVYIARISIEGQSKSFKIIKK